MDRDTGILWANLGDFDHDEETLEEKSKISGWEYYMEIIDEDGNYYDAHSSSLVANTTYAQDVDPNNKSIPNANACSSL